MSDPDVSLLLGASVAAIKVDPKEAKQRFQAAAQAAGEPCPSCGKVIVHRKGLGWCQDHEMREEGRGGLREKFTRRAKTRGWVVQHIGRGIATFDSAGNPIYVTTGDPGWPDLWLFNPQMKGIKVFAVELKREDGVVSPEQWAWLHRLNACGIPAVVIRPSDLRLGRVNAILEGR